MSRFPLGTHTDTPEVSFHEVQSLTINSDTPLPAHADGEILYDQAYRLDLKVHPKAMRLLC